MLIVVKLFPEITIKSRPVRRRFIRTLRRNIRTMLRQLDEGVSVVGEWDYIDVETSTNEAAVLRQIIQCLQCTPGIARFQTVERHPLEDLDTMAELCRGVFADVLAGKTFAVRCKRSGRHTFRSVDVERHVGGVLLHQTDAVGVNLDNPQVKVQLEIRNEIVFLVKQQYRGLGGFPLGTQDGVLSLISGGFDSAVSSFLCIKRGLLTHYCFFNLGGKAHEFAVKEVALYLWLKYSSSHRVRFVTVPFEPVVAEILNRVDDSQMGVVLKRMMLRCATEVADQLQIKALITGESVAQVSSQTLPNLAVIDRVTDMLVLRPLCTSDKQDIIDIARDIGTEDFSKKIPEYCGVISVKPTTRARIERIEREENRFDMALIDQAVAAARMQSITAIAEDISDQPFELKITAELESGDTVIDIRHPDEQERRPLLLPDQKDVEKLDIPFFQLQSYFADRDKEGSYLLYCDKGMMSALHAAHLYDQGYRGIAVYDPAHS
ncbi:MAG: tRNA 4-thiouridine(8) synthase ThiI [Gammaproteobacteria bacterium]|nr:tRNA 4-thiouridine(8) synthase ThiI [Gammaproteobacteria bacterium]